MKKFIAIVMLSLFSFTTLTQAQTTTPAQTKPAPTTPPAAPTTQHLKRDGTPDKRFKENKTTPATPAGPLTKKGKPDMRYKANNPNAGKKKKS